MTATAPLSTFAPTTVLCDTRPARGKHRTRRTAGDVADRLLRWSRSSRDLFLVSGLSLGAVVASVLA